MRRATPTPTSQPFWAAAASGQLSYPRCTSCGTWFSYLRPFCPICLEETLELEPVSGLGTVYSTTTVHRPASARFADVVPYSYALVDLDEGPRVVTMIVDCAPDEVVPDMVVRAKIDLSPDGEDAAPFVFFSPDLDL